MVLCLSWITLFVVLATVEFSFAYEPFFYNHTTPSIEAILVGRCEEYQRLNSQNDDPSLSVEVNCTTEFWEPFKNAFANKDACVTSIEKADYQPLFKTIQNGNELKNKSMLWSGTRTIVHDFTHVNRDYVTLEDSFTGYVANHLNWCGCENCSTGINFGFCNKSCSTPTSVYWDIASENFAKKAAGTVYVMVNGTTKNGNTAYYNRSVFGRVELPALGKMGHTTLLSVLVVFDVDEEPKEKCGEETLVQLVDDAHKHGIKNVQCTDDPSMVSAVLCAKYPSADQCQVKSWHDKTKEWKDVGIAMITVSSLFLVIIIILLILLGRKSNTK